jgi:hypothetical protein
MKKIFVMMLAAILALSATAFAATYNLDNDISFEYDENSFKILKEEHRDDEDVVALGFQNADWGDGFITIDLADVDTNSPFPTLEAMQSELSGVDVIQGDWANFKNVISFSIEQDGVTSSNFIVPIYDDDNPNKVDDGMTVSISVTQAANDQATADRDDAISNLVNSIKVIDD